MIYLLTLQVLIRASPDFIILYFCNEQIPDFSLLFFLSINFFYIYIYVLDEFLRWILGITSGLWQVYKQYLVE